MNTKEIDYYALGNRVCELRQNMKLTQDNFADLCGITRPTISNIENARTHASSDNLSRIAQVCGVSVDFLQYGSSCDNMSYESLSPSDIEYIRCFLKLNQTQKDNMMNMMKTFYPMACRNQNN